MYRSVITANEKFLFLKGMETLQLVIQPFAVIAVNDFGGCRNASAGFTTATS